MGLLERALKYKKQLNDTGRETLIDRIKGPAETDFAESSNSETININEIDGYDLPPIEELPESDIVDVLPETLEYPEETAAETPHRTAAIDTSTHQLQNEDLNFDEEIIILDDITSATKTPDGDVAIVKEHDYGKTDQKKDSDNPSEARPEEKTLHEKDVAESAIIDDDAVYHMPEFNDYAVLYEMLKEFTGADTVEEVYGTIIFSIMGQLGVSSVSIITPSESESSKWTIAESTGIKLPESEISWEVSSGILEILGSYRGVLDIEDLKDDTALRDDYYRFISVNARLMTPIIYEDDLFGVVLVGEKIDSAEFTPSEIDFLHSLSEAASSAIKAKINYDNANTELLGLRIEKEILWDVDIFQNSLLSADSTEDLEDIIRKNFYSLGIESYSIFLREEHSGDFYPAYFESDDRLGLADSGFRIKKDNRFAAFILSKKASIILDNFGDSNVIVETFGRDRVDNMSVFISYPFIMSGSLSGFLTIFQINPGVEIIDVDIRLQRIVRFIFPYIYRFIELDPEKNRFTDLTTGFYARFENELKRSMDMNIPVAVISVSIKNYKRYYDRFGRIEMYKMFETIAGIIKGRLYTGDFSVRIDRNKFIIVLPGKDKKYSATFTAILKNEISSMFNTSEFRLLITFISAVFPEDGKDIFSLLEVIE